MHLLESLLFMHENVSCFIKLIDMVAKVLWGSKLEKVSVEGRHVRLNVIKEEGLNEMASVNSDWNLLEELANREVLRFDFLL